MNLPPPLRMILVSDHPKPKRSKTITAKYKNTYGAGYPGSLYVSGHGLKSRQESRCTMILVGPGRPSYIAIIQSTGLGEVFFESSNGGMDVKLR